MISCRGCTVQCSSPDRAVTCMARSVYPCMASLLMKSAFIRPKGLPSWHPAVNSAACAAASACTECSTLPSPFCRVKTTLSHGQPHAAAELTLLAPYLVLVARVVLLAHRGLCVRARARGSAGSQHMLNKQQAWTAAARHTGCAHIKHACTLAADGGAGIPPCLASVVRVVCATNAQHWCSPWCMRLPSHPPALSGMVGLCQNTQRSAHRVVRQVRVTVVAVIARHGCCRAVPAPLSSAAG